MVICGRFPNLLYKNAIISVGLLMLVSSCTPATPISNPDPTPTIASSSLNGLGDTQVSSKDNATLVYIPAGQFPMGSEFGLTDEQPVHTVELDAFWMDRTEVTNEMYRKCVEAGKCEQPGILTYYDDPQFSNHPVLMVAWTDAAAYCSFVDRRLPTEAEWEKAAAWDPIKKEKLAFPWGNQYDCSKGNFDDETKLDASLMQDGSLNCDGYDLTAPVGSFTAGASPYGALDMGGNVWEWVHDAYIEVDPLEATIKNYYAISPASNPTGVDPAITEYRSMRGGSWNWTFGYGRAAYRLWYGKDDKSFGYGRAAYRLWYGKDDKYDAVGFRCAVSE